MKRSERGAVFIEFILVIPFIVGLMLASAEIMNRVHSIAQAVELSKATAQAVKRDCTTTKNFRQGCMARIIDDMNTVANNMSANSFVEFAVRYVCANPQNQVNNQDILACGANCSDVRAGNILNNVGGNLCNANVTSVVVAVAHVNYQPLIPSLNQALNFLSAIGGEQDNQGVDTPNTIVVSSII